MPLPPAFLDRLLETVGEEHYEEVLASFAAPQTVGFRVNTVRGEVTAVVEELEAEGLAPRAVEGLPSAFVVSPEERDRLIGSAAFREGRIYVQNLASQLPPVVLDPQPGEAVLDLCAAPGSKTTQLAALMEDQGELAAVELVRGRFFKLRAVLDQQGVTCARTFHRDGTTVWRHRPDHFDRILLDAPCSTEGRFRLDDPDTFRYWQPRKPKEMARKQRRLLESAVKSLRPGGVLVYSTCTFAPEENEGVLSTILDDFGDSVDIEPISLPPWCRRQPALRVWGKTTFHDGVQHAVRLLPTDQSEAFFVARLRRKESGLQG